MSLLSRLDLQGLSPAALWSALDGETREEAVRSVYGDETAKAEADTAIAKALRFRPGAVKQLPLERRVRYLLKSVHVDDSLATTLLLALHLRERTAILECFLDDLGIPQEGGLIDEDHDLRPPEASLLSRAAATLYERFDEAKVDLYLAALVALDPGTWLALPDVIAARRGS